MKVTHLLLDLDGTLTDSQRGITRCVRYALEKLGRPAPPEHELLWCIGPPLRENFSRLLETTDPARIEEAVVFYRERFATTGLFENSLYPDTIQALRMVHEAGIRSFVVTSKMALYARQIVQHFHLSPYLSGVYGSDPDGRFMDKVDLIAHVMKVEPLAPALTLMVGDREHDIHGAKRNGLRSAGVTYGYGSLAELQVAGPDYLFPSLLDLAAFVVRCR